ncbi:MAG: hypothetical protein ACRDS0_30760 [Pseudonocardiaceae bacterium]
MSRRARWWLGAAVTVATEVELYASYQAHEARFHWFTHFFVGGATALVLMAVAVVQRRRPVPLPGLWVILGHLIAMFPDFLFSAGIPHRHWMDVFLGHLSTHFMPGRNLTWYLVFLAALAGYLAVVTRIARSPSSETAS